MCAAGWFILPYVSVVAIMIVHFIAAVRQRDPLLPRDPRVGAFSFAFTAPSL